MSTGNHQQGVDVNQVAALLNLTPRRIQQLSKEGVLPKPERGRYHLAGCVRGYIAYLQKAVDVAKAKSAQPMIMDLQRERARKTAAEAELAELEVAKARGEYVSVADAGAAWGRALDLVVARLRTLGPAFVRFGQEVEAAAEEEAERIIQELHDSTADVVDESDDPEPEAKAA